MRFLTRSFMGLFLTALSAAFLFAAVAFVVDALKDRSAGHDASLPQERVFKVNVTTITPQIATPVIQTYGEVTSGRTLELRATSGGTLVKISENFRNGGQVKKGDLLFQIDPATARANANLAQAELDEAHAELNEAKTALTLAKDESRAAHRQYALRQQALVRQESLRDRGVGTEAALETAALEASSAEQAVLAKRQSVANARARITRAEITLTRSQINHTEAVRRLNETSVMAKFDGVLSDVTADLGALVNANERLARLIDPEALEVVFRISSAEFNRLFQSGHPLNRIKVRVQFRNAPDQIVATLNRISAAVGDGQTGRELYATLNTKGAHVLRPGDFVSVTLEEPPLEHVAILPSTAVSAADEILLVDPGNRLQTVQVDILRQHADHVIIAVDGLEGRDVVLERAPQLGEGIRVERQSDETALTDKETVKISEEERRKMIAFVKTSTTLSAAMKQNIIVKLTKPEIPKETYDRVIARMGG